MDQVAMMELVVAARILLVSETRAALLLLAIPVARRMTAAVTSTVVGRVGAVFLPERQLALGRKIAVGATTCVRIMENVARILLEPVTPTSVTISVVAKELATKKKKSAAAWLVTQTVTAKTSCVVENRNAN